MIFEEPAVDPKESSPANIVSLKSQACNVRDQLLLEDKDDKVRITYIYIVIKTGLNKIVCVLL